MRMLFSLGSLFLAIVMVGCDSSVSNNIGKDTTKVESWPTVQIEYQKTMQVGNDLLYMLILKNPELLDSIILYTIWKDTNAIGNFGGNEIKDTVQWIYNPGTEGNCGTLIRMYQKNEKKDTIVNTMWIDSFHVFIKKGSFGIQDLKVGDTLHLYVITESKYTSYVCQWYKDGAKIGDSFIKSGNDSVYYTKNNIGIIDAGEYSVSLDKPNAPFSEGGMTVQVNN